MELWLARLYGLLVSGLSLYGFLGLITLWLYYRQRRPSPPLPALTEAQWPTVTVQLPIYNERYVVERLIAAAARLDYPRDRLQIQVIDDSSDETVEIAAACVACWRQQGLAITHVRRSGRQGFKAGALAAATTQAMGEFIAFFDADFAPTSDFLRRTLPYFIEQPRLGVVQARWGHLNAAESALTAAQSLALDKHFAMEQVVRFQGNLFPKFNGAAGVWRRTCLVDAGGWQADTLCEDLCLSIRAVLDGWQFLYLNDLEAAAEIPSTSAAFKSQQARWATGVLQCLIKYFWVILLNPDQRLLARLYALASMSVYLSYVFALALLLVQGPVIGLDVELSPRLVWLSIAGLGQPLLIVTAQRALYRDWLWRLRYFPVAVVLGMGLAPNQCRALGRLVWQSIRRARPPLPFVRTPKGDSDQQKRGYRSAFDRLILVEAALAVYAALSVALAVYHERYSAVFLPAIAAIGLGYVAWLGIRERL